ncbi:DUF192 domain-containing protein [Myxococcota bacterium]|nr:DUF192 domain-containing protein [Myxococcota bacterium]MCZ7616887.1 DUF192 domain-containing protein [Myxococcota bacterium]
MSTRVPGRASRRSGRRRGRGPASAGLLALALALPLASAAVAQSGLSTIPVQIAGESFRLELAADTETMFRGLGGRTQIPVRGGMLFAYPAPRSLAFVMRDCLVPIDIAFLAADGRVLNLHTMRVEPPRGDDESVAAYEARLPSYRSSGPAQYGVEVAGGLLDELGVRPGDRIEFELP